MKNTLSSVKWITSLVALLLVGTLVLVACNVPAVPTQSTQDPVEAAVQTLQAQVTQQAFETAIAETTATALPPVPPTAVPPTNTPVVVATNINQIPTSTTAPVVQPTAVPTIVIATPVKPQPTKIVQPTATPVPCYSVKFEADVTIPDGAQIAGGTSFTKTWRLKNAGSCTWDTRFDLAFVSGDQMSAPAFVDMPKDVKPGEIIDLSVNLVAPNTAGSYTGNWMLVNPNGVRFGTGADGKGVFWVKITATANKGEVYNFATRACDAKWSSGASSSLPCPGKATSTDTGYVLSLSQPIREDGGTENEPGLVMRPNNSGSIYILGAYPNFTVKTGDRFKATIQCAGGATKCDIDMGLNYRVGNTGEMKNIKVWDEKYDSMWNAVDVDLSFLNGQTVQFILVVRNGSSTQDMTGLWLRPVIYRP